MSVANRKREWAFLGVSEEKRPMWRKKFPLLVRRGSARVVLNVSMKCDARGCPCAVPSRAKVEWLRRTRDADWISFSRRRYCVKFRLGLSYVSDAEDGLSVCHIARIGFRKPKLGSQLERFGIGRGSADECAFMKKKLSKLDCPYWNWTNASENFIVAI